MKRRLLICLLTAVFLTGCSITLSNNQGTTTQELTIFAAASLTNAFSEVVQTFESENPGVTVRLNFAGSSQLAAQLREGAVADVFASANPAQMEAVMDAGRIARGTESLFAANRLTIIVPADNPAGIATLADLARPGVRLLLAVPGVPIRNYSDEIVARMPSDLRAGFYDNLVSEEDNVRRVAAKIALGEADAGIVYTSDVTPDIRDKVMQIMIPDAQNVVATYPIALLADAPHPELARRFVNFVLGDDGQSILLRWGFAHPPGS